MQNFQLSGNQMGGLLSSGSQGARASTLEEFQRRAEREVANLSRVLQGASGVGAWGAAQNVSAELRVWRKVLDMLPASGMSAFGQDPKGLEAKPASPTAEGGDAQP